MDYDMNKRHYTVNIINGMFQLKGASNSFHHYAQVFLYNSLPIAQRVIQSGRVKWPFRRFSSSHRRTGVEQWYAGHHNAYGAFYPESTQLLLCDYQPLRPWNFMIKPHQAISESCYRGDRPWHEILLSCPFRKSASERTHERENIREAYQHHRIWMNRR